MVPFSPSDSKPEKELNLNSESENIYKAFNKHASISITHMTHYA